MSNVLIEEAVYESQARRLTLSSKKLLSKHVLNSLETEEQYVHIRWYCVTHLKIRSEEQRGILSRSHK